MRAATLVRERNTSPRAAPRSARVRALISPARRRVAEPGSSASVKRHRAGPGGSQSAGPSGYVLRAPPRERSAELGGAGDAGRDRARGCVGQQGEGPARAFPVDDGARVRSILRPQLQLAVCSSACLTISEMPPFLRSSAQRPRNP